MQWSLFVLIVMGQCSSIGGQLCDYHFIGEKKTWKEAQEYCRKNHTDLATVSNQTDMNRLQNHPKYQAGAWIGRQENTTNIVWRWSQQEMEFNKTESNWYQGQPNKVGDEEICVRMNRGTWDDDSCSNRYNFICYDEHKSYGETFPIIYLEMNWPDARSYCRAYHTDLISGVKQIEDFKTQHPYYANYYPRPFWRLKTGVGDSVILINQSMIWEDALYYCRDHYRDLVSITNLDDQRWVQERAKLASTPHVWLGLRYTCTLDFWFWVSDEPVHYKNWGPGQPGDECNMSGAMDRNGTWVKKIDDDHKLNFICSK